MFTQLIKRDQEITQGSWDESIRMIWKIHYVPVIVIELTWNFSNMITS